MLEEQVQFEGLSVEVWYICSVWRMEARVNRIVISIALGACNWNILSCLVLV